MNYYVLTSVHTNLGDNIWLVEPMDREPYLVHRPWWKRVVNTVLRKVQGRRPWLIVSRLRDGDPPSVVGYAFRRVVLLP